MKQINGKLLEKTNPSLSKTKRKKPQSEKHKEATS